MTFGLPHNLAPRLVNKSFNRATHIAAYVLMAGSAVTLASFQVWSPRALLWPAILAIIPLAAVLAILDRKRTATWALIYFAVGALTIFFVTWATTSQVDLVRSAELVGYPYLKSCVVLVGGIGLGRRRMLMWGTAGFLIAEIMSAAALAVAGVAWTFDPYTAFTYGGLVVLVVLSGSEGLRGRRVESRLRRAAHDEVAAAVVNRIQQRASAILHDTVLNHLATLSHTRDGPLSVDQRELLERDVALMHGTTLGETIDSRREASTNDVGWEEHPIHDAIRRARAAGLDIDMTGDPEIALALSPRTAEVVALAVTQSLVNVAKHSGVSEAEVAMHSTGTEVMIMIIDGGQGFDPEQVGADRLGIRNSIRGRIESVGGSVQIWAGIGKGTSIVMNVPMQDDSHIDPLRIAAERSS